MKVHLAKKSITLRLTLLFAAVSSAVLLLLGLIIGALVEKHFEELDRDLLGGKMELVRKELSQTVTAADLAALPQRLDAALVGHRGLWVRLRGIDGKSLYSSGSASFPAWEIPAKGDRSFEAGTGDGQQWRVLTGQAKWGRLTRPMRQWMWRPNS